MRTSDDVRVMIRRLIMKDIFVFFIVLLHGFVCRRFLLYFIVPQPFHSIATRTTGDVAYEHSLLVC